MSFNQLKPAFFYIANLHVHSVIFVFGTFKFFRLLAVKKVDFNWLNDTGWVIVDKNAPKSWSQLSDVRFTCTQQSRLDCPEKEPVYLMNQLVFK